MSTLLITTEAQAYSALERALAGKLPSDTELKFENWPKLTFVVRGDGFDASLTPPIMIGLLEFQKSLYKSYASIRYGNASKRLTNDEKDALQISISVKKGSSDLTVPFDELAKHLITELVQKMPSEYVLIAVLSIAVMYFGSSFLKTLLDNRKEVRLKEITDDTQRKTLEAMKFGSQQETQRSAILANAMSRLPELGPASVAAIEAHSEIIKSIGTAESADISGVTIDGDTALTLVQNKRHRSTEARLDGLYRLLKLDWSEPGSFKVRVGRVSDNLILDAEVQDDTLTGAYKDILKAAEWSRKPVLLSVNAKKVNEEYKNAVIVRVEEGTESKSKFR